MTKKNLMIQGMDATLIQIEQIKDIEEIRFKDLMPSSLGDKMTILPSLMIVYDGGKYLSLCSKDQYFDVLVRKAFQVYNQEKDRVLVDPTFDPFGKKKQLQIDERTKSVLESGDLTRINEIYGFYDGKKSYNNSLLFQSDTLKMLLPLVKYHLKQIFDCTNRAIDLTGDVITGYRNNYGLGYKLDGVDDTLLITFVSQNEQETYLRIRSKEGNFGALDMFINFNNNDITVNTIFKDYELLVNNIYEAKKNNTVVNTFRVLKNNEPIIFQTTPLSVGENPLPNVSALDSEDDVIWYVLPWNALYGVNYQVQALSEVDEIVMAHNKYIAFVNDEFMMKEYASKEYRRKKTFEANANRVVMDQVSKRITGIFLDRKEGIYVIETYFDNIMRNNGYYDAYLDDKYFYHLVQSKSKLRGLKRASLVTISQDNNIIKNADLLVTDDLKKIIMRR